MRTGCQWRNLPDAWPHWQAVYYYFDQWKTANLFEQINATLNETDRKRVERMATPSLLCIDSQSVKLSPMICKERGLDPNKRVNGRKRQFVVDTEGRLWVAHIHAANEADGQAGCRLVGSLLWGVGERLGDLLTHVVSRLRNWLSPEQICGVLARENAPTTLHHETIYRYIYQDYQTANAQKPGHQPLIGCLGIRHRKRYKQRGKPAKRELIPNRVSIDHRPAIVETNTEVGHWEADTIIGKGHDGVLLTLVERCTKFVLIVKLKSKNALALAKAAVKALRRSKLPLKTITFDNGLEFACHEHIARQLRAVTYFAHPYHSCGPPLWERGLNENTNGLIRQYIPKSCPIGIVRPSDVSAPAARLDRGTIKRPPPQNFGLSKPG